ncbi:MAG: UDP-N-acetylglucosamine 2-epimerase [Rhodothalassiaceae bacterium]
MREPLYLLTGARSELDYYLSLYEAAEASRRFAPAFIVSGMHLSRRFGHTVDDIARDGLRIAGRIDNLVEDTDAPAARGKSAGRLLAGLADLLAASPPAYLCFVGDREEALAAAAAGAYLRIPTVHIGAGDQADDGNVDNPVRHAASKLAHLHMAFTERSAARVRALGEEPWRVHVTGAPGLDRLTGEPETGDRELFAAIGFDPGDAPFALVIQHPILSDLARARADMEATLEALARIGCPAFVSAPNSDAGHRAVFAAIEEAASTNPRLFHYPNLPRPLFVNLFRRAAVLVGNSSAGLIEAPFLGVPAVNVGLRQRGREHGESVIFVDGDADAIEAALRRAMFDPDFRALAARAGSPYGDGQAGRRIHDILAGVEDRARLLFKRHVDAADREGERR